MEPKKLNNYSFKIEKHGTMKVPAIVYASEKLFSKIKDDKTIQQIINVASLKGIVKNAIAMPDAHQGYGFPIGGVAAFDIQEGIISPGGVGYDINCLIEDSRILSEHGFFKEIKDFENDFIEIENTNKNAKYSLKSVAGRTRIISFDYEGRNFHPKNALFFMKKEHKGKIVKIKTKLGYEIKLTEKHPILTEKGMVKAGLLNEKNTVAVNPFAGIEYEKISQFEIVSENNFSEEQKKELKERNLLPFNSLNENLPVIAKLFGYLLGDGNIHISNNKGRICAYGPLEDLEQIKNDFEKLRFSARIYSRERNHEIETRYGIKKFSSENHELHVSSTSLANLFYQLGYPKGSKTTAKFSIPVWIKKSPKWIKRLFISALFGAELSSPKTHTKTGFNCPIFSINKNKEFLENGRKFCIELMNLLAEFGVETNKISERKEHKNKSGETYRIRLQISSKEENLLRLYSQIGFLYNKKRDALSKIAVLYIKEKKKIAEKRTEIAFKVKKLKKKGLKLKEVQEIIESKYANKRFIERHYYENAKQRINLDFISFEDFKKSKMTEFEKYGLFFDEIESIDCENFNGFVYDLNIDETHNFIANNIVVSNCGVRMLRTNFTADQIMSKRKELLDEIYKEVPAGVGKGGVTKLTRDQTRELLEKGAEWAIKQGYGTKEDLLRTEENGQMKSADANAVSERAISRGNPQLGTLGSGNHFLEIQKVDAIYDNEIAKRFGIDKVGQVVVMIHCGSRGLGHQVASDYIKKMEDKYGFEGLPDRELINAPITSELGEQYYKAMGASMNFAFANRQMIAHWTREVFKKVFGTNDGMEQIYDVCHNIAKFEEHVVDGEKRKLCVHRKGATRSFGPGREEIPEIYRDVGQPVIIPGSMGTASYLLVGTKEAEELTFGSTAHGAGRVSSRAHALHTFTGEQIRKNLLDKNIEVKSASMKGLAEEAPEVYKDIDEVIKVSSEAKLGKPIARLVPLAVMKG
jgi:tRNA-splicing ligase RtcB (3'-phosphate/5'-hydroxy nucleic acid ligase)